MTRVILKPSRDADLYAVYSENTDAVLFAGDRDAACVLPDEDED